MPRKLTTEEFIEKAIKIHGSKYDYSKVKYDGKERLVTIICSVHGEFQQQAGSHLVGKGCKKCANEQVGLRCKLDTNSFIKKAIEIHGSKYDYSKVEYVNSQTKVSIICTEHGEFQQIPASHLHGNGCPKCAGNININTDEFIKKATEVHDSRYDYSKVEYVNMSTKVTIICPVHGEFHQLPNDHLNGSNCPACAFNKITTLSFIKRAKEAHGERYDYSKTIYKNKKTKVTIICPVHGEFQQLPYAHLRGSGCFECGKKQNYTTEEFIKKAKEIHGSRYDYSKVEYIDTFTKVTIICPVHGEFQQLPSIHLSGHGCDKCGGTYKPTTEEFIKKAKGVHRNHYDYSKVNYVNCCTKVSIICPIHGEFEQLPTIHLKGAGCPKCKMSKLEKEIINYCDNKGIEYIYQYRDKWLKKQSLDFYFPKFNVGVECQGIQHFIPIDFFGKEKGFKEIRKRDIKKKKLCNEQGINVLYFTKENYTEFLEEPLYKDVGTLFTKIYK